MKSFFTRNVKIALVVILCIIILYWGINFLKGVNLFKPTNYYVVNFERVDGITVSTPVTVKGFQVGQVSEINYDYDNNKVSVVLSLDKEFKVPVGSTVVKSSELLGGAQLALNLSNSKDYYDVGDEIPAAITQGLMDKVGADVMPQVTALLPKVDSILVNVNSILSSPALQSSVLRIDAITAELAASAQQLNMLMTQLNKTVPGTMNNVNGITTNLTSATSDLSVLSNKLKTMPIDQTMNELNTTLANLKQLTAKLNDPNSSLGLLLNDKKLYNDLDQTVQSLDALLKDFKENPKRYVSIKVF